VIGLLAINLSRAGVARKSGWQAAQTLRLRNSVRPIPSCIFFQKILRNRLRKAGPAGSGVQHSVRHCARDGSGGPPAALLSLRKSRRDDVQVHQPGDVLCAFRGRRCDRIHVGSTGMGILLNLAKCWSLSTWRCSRLCLECFCRFALLARVPLSKFVAAVAEPVSIAFGTASSEAALPRAMEAIEGMGVPREVVAFVMPTGYSFNLDGSTLYLSLASIFVAQAAGISSQRGTAAAHDADLMLTSKGVAGVSRAALVILLGTVGSFAAVSRVFILLGIDQLMDMGRTAVTFWATVLATVWGALGGDFGDVALESVAREACRAADHRSDRARVRRQ